MPQFDNGSSLQFPEHLQIEDVTCKLQLSWKSDHFERKKKVQVSDTLRLVGILILASFS